MADENPLRPKPVPPPPPSAGHLPEEQMPGEGKVPLKRGKAYFSDATRKSLEAVGWKEGDPIPGDLGKRLQALQDEVNAENSKLEDSELAAGWKPVKSEFVKIEDLPPEKQEVVRQYLRDHKAAVAEQRKMTEAEQRIESQIPQNIQGEQRDLMRQQMLQGEQAKRAAQQQQTASVVVDDRNQDNTLRSKMDRAAAMEEARNQTVDETPEEPTVTPTTPQRSHCQRCSWPLDNEFNVEVT